MRRVVALALIQVGFLAACGGGGGSGSSIGGGGGGGGGGTPPPTQIIAKPGHPNVEPLVVDEGPAGNSINTAYVTIKLCAPGTTTCAIIDHVELDTGSSGLRVLSSALKAANPSLVLPLVKDAGGNTFTECQQFADGSAIYGWVGQADMTLPTSGETTVATPDVPVNVHVIGDGTYSAPPPGGGCTGTLEADATHFGANGLLGVGPFINDCNSAGNCPAFTGAVQNPIYYTCPPATPNTGCSSVIATAGTTGANGQQVQNPIALFMTDNNGVIVELPAVGAGAGGKTSGSLVFGIGTRSNNGLGSATVLTGDVTNNAFIGSTFNGQTYADTYLDAGSDGNFFTDSSITQCPVSGSNPGFYCPTSTVNESATLKGLNSNSLVANFSVSEPPAAAFTAFPNLGGTNSDPSGLALGLPFFFGRNVYTAIENANTPGGIGPYFAY